MRVSFTDGHGFSESLTSGPATGSVSRPATGAPTISGTVAEGETLTAPVADIRDENGLDAVEFNYQWISGDGTTYTDIEGATGSSYTLTAVDACTLFRARVSFTDNDGFFETLTSAVARDEPPTPTEVAFTEVPMVVESTSADYFVLYASHDWDSTTLEYPVRVVLGEDGNTTLAENVAALPVERYRVEKYLVADPADVDGDCIDDITELNNLGDMNPLNSAAPVTHGYVVIPDFETFERLSFDFPSGASVIKFLLIGLDSEQPQIYFMDTNEFPHHWLLISSLDADWVDGARGRLVYDPDLVAADGRLGVFRYQLPLLTESFSFMERVHTLLAANMPLFDDNLALWIRNVKLPAFRDDLPLYRASRIDVVFDDEVHDGVDFLAMNQGEGYGVLRSLEADERPHPRDVVIYQALPNELPRVAGIISTVPQTPLSHVNLRAVQDGIPNAFVRDALDNDDIDDLIDSHVYYQVTGDGYTIRAATPAEVEAHYASSRPAEAQTPQRDLTATSITPLSEIDFDDWDAFGVKAANVAVLRTLGLPEGTVPDGFAVPFYFYDEFMKHNDLYEYIEEMLADEDFQTDYDEKEDELKKLRKKIKKGETPVWIETALTTMHATYPEGQSLRYRSSTNNEDLPNFNGAGLYDSKTQHPEETEEDGISKSLKQVYASLWNFRAFVERDFNRVDHLAAAMGVLVHPNYSDELVNGVAVSFDPAYGTEGTYYVNSQVGEDLVTNPEAHSVPEEILLQSDGTYKVVTTSNQVTQGQLLMTDTQMERLRQHLATIHEEFNELYGVKDGDLFAMEIEFKITSDNVLAIKQARPWSVHTVAPPPNTPATGAPAITGTARVGETLTADTSGFADEDGLDDATFSYQWMRNDGTTDTDIQDAASSTYTLVSEDFGKPIKVRVSFTDDAGNEETLTSPPLDPSRPYGLTAAVSGRTVVLTWNSPVDFPWLFDYRILRNRPELGEDEPIVYVETGTAETTYSDTDVEPGVLYVYRLKAANFFGRFSKESEPVEIRTPAWTPVENSPATGQPTISGAAQVGETLTADTLGIADEDGLENVTYVYQWLADDAEIAGATGSSYTLADSEEGMAIKVKLSFTDDAGNPETLTSAATASVAAAPVSNTLVGFTLVDASDPSEVATLTEAATLTLEDPANGSYGIKVEVAENTGIDSVRLELSGAKTVSQTENILPYSLYGDKGADLNGEGLPAGSYTLRATAYSEDNLGGDELQLLEISFTVTETDSAATGAPTISGTLQVGETLTADTSGIDDSDGLDDVSYSYQWLVDDTDVAGATGSNYTLTEAEKGKAIKVRVSFTDDVGNAESLTSDATEAVAARPLSMDDFDAGEGRAVLGSALIRVGDRGRKNDEGKDRAWYATETSAWHASGVLRDGSLSWNDMTLNRVVYSPETGEFRFNEADAIHIGESFAAGGVNRESTVWIQTETGVVSFLAKDNILNSGSGWINFQVPETDRATLDAVAQDDLIIVAVSAPATP